MTRSRSLKKIVKFDQNDFFDKNLLVCLFAERTFKPMQNGHSWDPKAAAVKDKWSFPEEIFYEFIIETQKDGFCRQVAVCSGLTEYQFDIQLDVLILKLATLYFLV